MIKEYPDDQTDTARPVKMADHITSTFEMV
jgi:hypothetical protein